MLVDIQNERVSQVASLIVAAQRVVAFTGAGISTESGIPDFRSPHSGLWENVDVFKVASIFGFKQNPAAFFNWVHPLAKITLTARPNPAHDVLSRLEELGFLHCVITQNIDMLHTHAGNKNVLELHGHLREATCIHCFTIFEGEPILRQFVTDGKVPICPLCEKGILKPNVILFGEQLPYQVIQSAKEAVISSDLMLIVGSSLSVAPASDLPIMAKENGAKLVILNLEATGLDHYADIIIQGCAAELLPAILQQIEDWQ